MHARWAPPLGIAINTVALVVVFVIVVIFIVVVVVTADTTLIEKNSEWGGEK